MAVMHRNAQKQYAAEGEERRRRREAQEQAMREQGARDWERLKSRCRADKAGMLEARATEEAQLAAMSPEQLAAHYHQQNTRPLDRGALGAKPDYYWLAMEDVKREEREERDRERQERERKDGTLRRREKWEADRERIAQRREGALRAEHERHQAENVRHQDALRSIRNKAEGELTRLGDRP